jgi:outer membrane protein assembly factor BamB
VSITIVVGLATVVFTRTPSVYPTGTTIYQPSRSWSGYTVFLAPDTDGAIVIDMNGRLVKQWKGLSGTAGGPARVLPGGHLIASSGSGAPHQEALALVQLDWNGKEVWRFDRSEQVRSRSGETIWSARQHHDWQRPGLAAGYFAPGSAPSITSGNTLLLTHKNVTKAEVSDRRLEDDRLIEVSWEGKVLWEWLASDHAGELGLSDAARDVIRRGLGFNQARDSFDWLHINAAAYVGPNRWFDAGDRRFSPDHIIISSREANIIAIVARDGRIVWRMGPDYTESDALRRVGQVIGQHNPHIIPVGLPGAGNLLVFDNGGAAGYGFANPVSPDGRNSLGRGSSRVLEVNPVTFEKVWEYSVAGAESFRFFSHYVSGAQRLPNGNTMITEGADGRIFEVTTGGEIVWEYVSPYFTANNGTNRVYRAYRVPYDWIPQLPRPAERAVVPPNVREFRIEAQGN